MTDELSLPEDYLARIILMTRALFAKEGTVTPDPGGNPTDDERPAVLQDAPDSPTREQLIEEIQGLDSERQNELVALMWLGRGDGDPEDWERLKGMAAERAEVPTEAYLLDHPLVAEYWAAGLDALGYGSVTMDYRGQHRRDR